MPYLTVNKYRYEENVLWITAIMRGNTIVSKGSFMYTTPKWSVNLLFQLRQVHLLICFCSLYLSCPILEKDHFIENLYIVLFF